MTIRYSKSFKKRYKLLPAKTRIRVDDRLRLFAKNPRDTRLRMHPLKGKLSGYYSINVSGDLGAIYKKDKQVIIFTLVGTHSQLYG